MVDYRPYNPGGYGKGKSVFYGKNPIFLKKKLQNEILSLLHCVTKTNKQIIVDDLCSCFGRMRQRRHEVSRTSPSSRADLVEFWWVRQRKNAIFPVRNHQKNLFLRPFLSSKMADFFCFRSPIFDWFLGLKLKSGPKMGL